MNEIPPNIVVVTSNPGKAQEFASLLRIPVTAAELDHPEVQSLDPIVVARDKAARAYAKLRRPLITDDTGLALRAWNGYPGALISWALESAGPYGFVSMAARVDDRRATVVTALACADETGIKVFTGQVHGLLANVPAGNGGQAWDSIFIPGGDAGGRTLAEMRPAEREQHSSRRQAIQKMIAGLGASEAAPAAPS